MTLTIESIENNFSDLSNYKLINKQDYYILSFDYNNLDFLINICKDSEYIYIVPDENKYSKKQLEIIDKINIDLIYSNDLSIIKNFKYFGNSKKEKVNKFKDDYGIFREKDVYNKGGCNFDNLYNNLISSNKKSEISISKISKNLLFNNKQVIDILINEIKKVNSNKNHMHYILPTDEPFIFT